MEVLSGTLGLILIIALVWYFGSTINKVVAKVDHVIDNSAEMASDEFDYLRAEQRVRLAKQFNDLGSKVAAAEHEYGKSDLNSMLSILENGGTK
jgi:hypothetical protein